MRTHASHLLRRCAGGAFCCISAVALLIVGFATGCQSRSETYTGSAQGVRRAVQVPRSWSQDSYTVDETLAAQGKRLHRMIQVSGRVDKVEVREVGDSLALFIVNLKSGTDSPLLAGDAAAGIDLATEFSRRLAFTASLLMTAAEQTDLNLTAGREFKHMGFDLKRAGNRILGLGNFFRSHDQFEVGNSLEKIATGYLQLGDAYTLFSASSDQGLKSGLEIGGQTVTSESEIKVIEVEDNKAVEASASVFQDSLLNAGGEFLTLADDLISQRKELKEERRVFEFESIPVRTGYSLITVGNLLQAKSWEFRKQDDRSGEAQYRMLGDGFKEMGRGLNDLFGGFHVLGETMAKLVKPSVLESLEYPVLRCAYAGYNRDVIRDCVAKINQAGVGAEIILHGRLVRGNLREEMDLLWLNAYAVTVDELVIDLTYGDESSASKNLSRFSKWVSDLDQ